MTEQLGSHAEVIRLADRLKTARADRGISQSQAARELDVARTAYRLWEMEAARPAPDRWRLVARWLGVSMSTLLVAQGLISEEEETASNAFADRYLAATGTDVDTAATVGPGDFFAHAEAMIEKSLERGLVSPAEAEQFRATFERIEKGLGPDAPS